MKKNMQIITILILALVIFTGAVSADYYSNPSYLRYGLWSNEVKNLQQDLKDLGYFTYYTTTTYYGSFTYNAVVTYQRDKNIGVDGIVGPVTASEIKRDKVVLVGKSFIGVPYQWGGSTPSGFDCSGFTAYVFKQNGLYLPRTSSQQYNFGTWINRSYLKNGDLVFFNTSGSGVSHVGIYIGKNKFIHASSSGVMISDLNNSYWNPRYMGAKRII
ncbi:MAG: NlpC/P60 family protein [Eubacteriales bacterium]